MGSIFIIGNWRCTGYAEEENAKTIRQILKFEIDFRSLAS